MVCRDGWEPDQYEQFKAERSAPFFDLLALLARDPAPALVVDLGCGTGELTRHLHRHLGSGNTVGIDSSQSMLERAASVVEPGLRFDLGDIASFGSPSHADVVFSNAALQWLPDHRSVLARWSAALSNGGQMAVQVPFNRDHPSHLIATDVANEEPFASAFERGVPADPVGSVLAPEEYAVLLDDLGFSEQHVRLQVYGHRLAASAEVVEWTKGTSLTRFRTALPEDMYERFVARYRLRLLDAIGDHRPYFYAFKRILFWGRKR